MSFFLKLIYNYAKTTELIDKKLIPKKPLIQSNKVLEVLNFQKFALKFVFKQRFCFLCSINDLFSYQPKLYSLIVGNLALLELCWNV